MSRPQKIHPPIKGDFNSILAAVATGSGTGKRAAENLARNNQAVAKPAPVPPKKI
jgi:hypothetical protein